MKYHKSIFWLIYSVPKIISKVESRFFKSPCICTHLPILCKKLQHCRLYPDSSYYPNSYQIISPKNANHQNSIHFWSQNISQIYVSIFCVKYSDFFDTDIVYFPLKMHLAAIPNLLACHLISPRCRTDMKFWHICLTLRCQYT